MPLTDLVRTLNAPHGVASGPYAHKGLDEPFVAADGRVFLHYAGIRLESHFQPLVGTRQGGIQGHAAVLQAFGLANGIPLLPEAVFVIPTDDAEFIYLDRLVRTLHALNYLTQPVRGNLLLKVHTRHVLSVPADHGLAFEEILRPCGLLPEQITLEIDSDDISAPERLSQAVANYRARGYGIAASRFGRTRLDFDRLQALRPDIVRLDPLLLASVQPLAKIIDRLQQLPARLLVEQRDAIRLHQLGLARHIDLLQVPRYSPPRKQQAGGHRHRQSAA